MEHPLEKYRLIADSNFISRVEDKFYTVYYDELNAGVVVKIERDNDRMYVNGFNMDGEGFDGYVTFSSYFIKEYNKIEIETRSAIDSLILSYMDEKKQEVFIKGLIAELQLLQNELVKPTSNPKHEIYKSIQIDKIQIFSKTLNEIYLTAHSPNTPKIQWLGKTNVLATLIYDLWQGQDKGEQANTKPVIKALKKDLEVLLINNFLDAKGQQLTQNTISDYLNTSKPEKRAKNGVRIELDF